MAVGIGDINIVSYVGSESYEKVITGVLYVPDLCTNLMSLTKLLDLGYKLFSDNERIEILDEGKVVALGKRSGGLFKMDFVIKEEVTSFIGLKEWHERFGHMNLVYVKNMLKRDGIQFQQEVFECEECIQGKLHREPYLSSKSKSSRNGDLIHADLCGPMENISLGGSKYFLLFKDDFSHYRKVYFLKTKSEVAERLRDFIYWVEKQCDHKVKVLRTDCGREFVNKENDVFLKRNGITHQKSVPYSPEQNGRIEREMRTVVEMARTLLHAKNLDVKLWAEAVSMAIFILNRTGISTQKHETSFELWTGRKFDVKDLRIFGSEIYVHIPKNFRRKFDVKGRKELFVGFDEETKGYRAFDSSRNVVHLVRDVKFLSVDKKVVDRNTKRIDDQRNFKIVLENLDQKQIDKICKERNLLLEANIGNDEDFEMKDLQQESIEDVDMRDLEEEGCLFVNVSKEPRNYEEVKRSKEKENWLFAMKEEIDSLEQNKTWVLVDEPKGRKFLDNKWIFKIKRNLDGSVERYKARLVIRGFGQINGIDYGETYSPVVRYSSVRMILALAVKKGMMFKQFDIKTAFLYGELKEDIFMWQPDGFNDGTKKVCKLIKSLYGLKQSPRCWNEPFVRFIEEFGFEANTADSCVFISR